MFQFTLSKEELLTPLLTVAGAIDKKHALPVLSNVLIEVFDDYVSLTGTDLELEIRARIPCHNPGNSGRTTVAARKLVDIVRSLEDGARPTISCADSTLTLTQGRGKYRLSTLPADTFPASEREVSEVEFTLARESLLQVLQATHFAMSQQDVRIFLNGLLLEFDGNGLTAVATDGHRMAISRIPLEQKQAFHRLLLPRKSIQEMLRLLQHVEDASIGVSAGKNHFCLQTAQFTFMTRVIDSRFPAYSKAIPAEHHHTAVIDSDLLRRTLSRIVILAHEKSRAVRLHLQPSQLTLVANNQQREEAEETLEAQTTGGELTIGINASYMLDVLNFLSSGRVRLSFSGSDSSILLESTENADYQYIIMPMKL